METKKDYQEETEGTQKVQPETEKVLKVPELDKATTKIVDMENLKATVEKESDKEGNEGFKFTVKKRVFYILLLVSSMCYKFSYESFSTGISLIILQRMPKQIAVTSLGIVSVVYNVAQTVTSPSVIPFTRIFRASTILSLSFVFFALVVSMLLLTELCTGGSFWTPFAEDVFRNQTRLNYIFQGNFSNINEFRGYANNSIVPGWSGLPYLCIIVKIFGGICYGYIEVLRKLLVPIIAETKSKKVLEKMNSVVHICYELSGTAGAFLSGVLINTLGPVYCMSLFPISYFLAALFCFCIWHKFEPLCKKGEKIISTGKTNEVEVEAVQVKTVTEGNAMVFFTNVWTETKRIGKGLSIVFCTKSHYFIVICYCLPQVLHRLKENVLGPFYAKSIVKDNGFAGYLLGSSNFGELLGAIIVLLSSFCKCFRQLPLAFSILGMICINLLWVLPWIAWGTVENSLQEWGLKILCMGLLVVISLFYASGDISILSYIGGTVQENLLPSVLSGFYIIYVLIMVVLSIGMGQIIDSIEDPRMGMSVSLIILSLLTIFVSIFAFSGCFTILNGEEKKIGGEKLVNEKVTSVELEKRLKKEFIGQYHEKTVSYKLAENEIIVCQNEEKLEAIDYCNVTSVRKIEGKLMELKLKTEDEDGKKTEYLFLVDKESSEMFLEIFMKKLEEESDSDEESKEGTTVDEKQTED